MLLISNIFLLLVIAVTFRREFKNHIIRVFLFVLLYYLQSSNLESEVIGIHQSIFHSKGSAIAVITSFLLGCLSSCIILPGSAFLYADCGITSLDNWIGIYQS